MRDLDFKLPEKRQKSGGDEQYVPIPSLEVLLPAFLNNIFDELVQGKEKLNAAKGTDERGKNQALMALDKGIEAVTNLSEDFQYENYYARLHKEVQASRKQEQAGSWEERAAGAARKETATSR